MTLPRVIVCGNVVLDILARPVESPLRWGATSLIDQVEQHLGGNAGTTSYTLAKLGTPVTLIGLVGRDSSAEALISILEEAGVHTDGLQFTDAPTSTAISLVDRAGARALLYHLGASAEDFSEPLEFPAGAAHFHLAAVYRMRYLRTAAPRILKSAQDSGLQTSVDTQWDHEGEWLKVLAPSLPFTDILFVNEEEARILAGCEDPAAASQALAGMGARTVVVKLGANGCLVDGQHVPGFQVETVDTTGAGDCFVGGFLAARLRGATSVEAARFANAVGALAVQKLGAVRGVVSHEETSSWIAAQSAIIPGT